jgi:hypothetical protein
VVAPLAIRRDARFFENMEQLISGELTSSPKFFREEFPAAGEILFAKPELPVAPCTTGNNTRGNKAEYPPYILRGSQMQRAPYHPGTHDFMIVNSLPDIVYSGIRHAESNRPEGACIVLSLDGTKCSNDLPRIRKIRAQDLLVLQPPPGNIQGSHNIILAAMLKKSSPGEQKNFF